MSAQPMNVVQLSLDMPTVFRFYRRMWGKTSVAMSDERFLIKTVLTEVFPGVSPRPWRVQRFDPNGETVILGYSAAGQDRLRELAGDALPELASAFVPDSIVSRPLRAYRRGERFQVHATYCATRRMGFGERRIEKDAYELEPEAAKREERKPRGREEVYAAILGEPLSRVGSIGGIRITGWRSASFARKDPDGVPRDRVNTFPAVDAVADLEVGDPDLLSAMLAVGFGRGRAYGYGMLLLRPA